MDACEDAGAVFPLEQLPLQILVSHLLPFFDPWAKRCQIVGQLARSRYREQAVRYLVPIRGESPQERIWRYTQVLSDHACSEGIALAWMEALLARMDELETAEPAPSDSRQTLYATGVCGPALVHRLDHLMPRVDAEQWRAIPKGRQARALLEQMGEGASDAQRLRHRTSEVSAMLMGSLKTEEVPWIHLPMLRDTLIMTLYDLDGLVVCAGKPDEDALEVSEEQPETEMMYANLDLMFHHAMACLDCCARRELLRKLMKERNNGIAANHAMAAASYRAGMLLRAFAPPPQHVQVSIQQMQSRTSPSPKSTIDQLEELAWDLVTWEDDSFGERVALLNVLRHAARATSGGLLP